MTARGMREEPKFIFRKASAPKGTIRYEMIREAREAVIKPVSDKIKKGIIQTYLAKTRRTPIKTIHRIYQYPGFKVTFDSGVQITITEVSSYTVTKPIC